MSETLSNTDAITAPAGNPVAQFQQRFAQLPQKNKIAILLGVPLLIAFIVSGMLWASKPNFKVLFSGLNDQDGGAIVEALNQLKVPYEYSANGTAIMVPSDKVYDTRLALASRGLPKGSITGFEAMDNQRLGITQFQEQVNYQRALEGELVRSIQSISAVQSARVHLAIPKPSIFIRERQTPSASIVLNLYGNRTLTEAQVNGIVHLVASSLPGMNPESVSIVDQTGRLLTVRSELNESMNPTQLAYTNQIEQNLASRIVNILTPVFGANNVRATVTANMDFSTSERTDEIFKPNSDPTQATVRSQQISESQDAAGNNPQGIPGTMTNTPPGEAAAAIGQNPQDALANPNGANANTAASRSSRRDSTMNYEVDKTVQYRREQVGRLQRLSAAVVVNHKTITDPKGAVREVPLTTEEMAQIDSLVKQAIGFEEARGDAVNVVNQAFTRETFEEQPLWTQAETLDMLKSLGMPLGLALIAAILVFGVFRPMMRPAQTDLFTDGPELLPGQSNGLIPIGPNDDDMALLEELQREGTISGASRQQKLEKLRELAKNHPQIVANIVKNWVNGETQNPA